MARNAKPTLQGERVFALRTALGYSQTELGRLAGISQSAISRIEKNAPHQPLGENERSLAAALKTSLEFLRGIDEVETVGLTTAPDDAPHINASVAGWDDAVKLARLLDPSLPEAAIERAGKAARLLTTAHASPELVLQLAHMAMRFGGDDMFAAIRAEGLARQQKRREGADAEQTVEGLNELSDKGRKDRAAGRIAPKFPPDYEGATTKPAANDGKK